MEYLQDYKHIIPLCALNYYCPEVQTKSIGVLVETQARRAITKNGEVTTLCRYIGIETCQ